MPLSAQVIVPEPPVSVAENDAAVLPALIVSEGGEMVSRGVVVEPSLPVDEPSCPASVPGDPPVPPSTEPLAPPTCDGLELPSAEDLSGPAPPQIPPS